MKSRFHEAAEVELAEAPDGHLDSPTCGHQKFPHPRRELHGDEKGKIF
jgi:hypothetical protein